MSQIQPAPTLKKLLADPSVTLAQVVTHLESLSAEEKLNQCMSIGRAAQRRLFQLCADSPAVTIDDFVPANLPPLTPVVHEGRNTLPLFTRFQKVFCKPADGSNRLFGFNEGFTRKLIGPGYFVGHTTDVAPSEATWPARGPVVVNYFMVPDAEVPAGWPKVVPNSKGLQVLVYNGTRDFMRKVCDGVTIGEAFKGEKSIDNYFVLVRQ